MRYFFRIKIDVCSTLQTFRTPDIFPITLSDGTSRRSLCSSKKLLWLQALCLQHLWQRLSRPDLKAADLSKLYERFEEAGYSTLELMENTKRVLISGVVLDVGQSLNGNPIFKVGAHPNSQELARLTAADDTQENKLNALQAGVKFKAVCDLAFSSGAQYMSFQGCVFK